MRFLVISGLLLAFSASAKTTLPTNPLIRLPEGVTLREVKSVTSMPLLSGKQEEERGCYIEITMPKFQYKTDAEKSIAMKRISRKWFKSALRSTHNFLKEIEEDGRCTEEYYNDYQVNLSYSFASQHKNMVSMVYTNYEYAGGAHGYAGYSSQFLDFTTGKEISGTLDTFLKPEFLPVLVSMMDFKLKQREYFDPSFGWDQWKQDTKNMKEIENFYFNGKGLVLFFNPYAIGSYAEGIIEVELTWEEIRSLKKNSEAASALP